VGLRKHFIFYDLIRFCIAAVYSMVWLVEIDLEHFFAEYLNDLTVPHPCSTYVWM